MSIQINRFETKEIKKEATTVQVNNLNSILIQDHANDKVVAFIQLDNKKSENLKLANRIITTIEDFILEKENVSED